MMRRIGFLLLLLLIELCAAQSDTCKANTEQKCRNKGGLCQHKSKECAGPIREGSLFCKDSESCVCCAPCAKGIKPPCTKLKGKCMNIDDFCNGTEIMNKAFCKQEKLCKCCIPSCDCEPATCKYNNQDGRCSRHRLPDTKNVGPQECKNGCECYIPDNQNNNPRWSMEKPGCIAGHNNKNHRGISSLEVCKELCETETEFKCISIDYFPLKGVCRLSTADSTSESYMEPCFKYLFAEIISDPIDRVPTTPTVSDLNVVPTAKEHSTTKDGASTFPDPIDRVPTTPTVSDLNVVPTTKEHSTTKDGASIFPDPIDRVPTTPTVSDLKKEHSTTKDGASTFPGILTVDEFISRFNKIYESWEERVKRIEIFTENIIKMTIQNNLFEAGIANYQMAVNEFSDMTYEEVLRDLTGLNVSDIARRQGSSYAHGGTYIPKFLGHEPKSMDYRRIGAVNPIRKQYPCNSCWAFTSTSSIESQIFLKKGILLQLSEQYLIDCMPGYSCERLGHYVNAIEYVRNNGIPYMTDYPYKGRDEPCNPDARKTSYKVISQSQIRRGSEEDLLNALVHLGPINIAFDVTDKFTHYGGGIFYDNLCKQDLKSLKHAMVLVGYGTENGIDYWLLRNSWGDWGEQGYIKVPRGVNQCGIATFATVPIIEDPCRASGGRGVVGQCLVFKEGSKTWAEAESTCEANGQRLAVPLNPVAISAYLQDHFGGYPFWLGGSDRNSEGTWTWINGIQFGDFPWPSGQPNNGNGNQDCLAWGLQNNYNADDCNKKYNFICEPDPCIVDGGKTVAGQCLIFNKEPKTWDQAVSSCEAKGQQLAVLKNAAALEIYLKKNYGGKRFWLGGSDRNSEGTWTWINGKQFGDFPWPSGQPDNGNGNQDCLEWGWQNNYNDNNCNNEYNYICEQGGPQGYFGLPKPKEGCPLPASQWLEGSRYQDSENNNNQNAWSDPTDLYEGLGNRGHRLDFCLKKYPDGSPWPAGNYCIHRFRNACPQGFNEGKIYWDDEDSNNNNKDSGTLPDGVYGRDTRYYYCCRSDGNSPIYLPFGKPFFLYPYTSGCQEVIGMKSRMEWVYWDNEDNNNNSGKGGAHPKVDNPDGMGDFKLYYCYYYY